MTKRNENLQNESLHCIAFNVFLDLAFSSANKHPHPHSRNTASWIAQNLELSSVRLDVAPHDLSTQARWTWKS